MSSAPALPQEGTQPSTKAVIITLDVASPPPSFRIQRRIITLDSQHPSMSLGRSSKVSSKGFTPELHNGWFDSPVMSRNHAALSLDPVREKVLLTDTGSLHGTYVDHQKLEHNIPKTLSDNDKIRFGVQISRSAETFPPCYIIARIHWTSSLSETQPSKHLPGNYSLPDESDNDNSSDSADSEPEDDRPHTQQALASLEASSPTVILDMTMQADNVPESKSDEKEPPNNITRIDLTADDKPEAEASCANTSYAGGSNLPTQPVSPHISHHGSYPASPSPSTQPPDTVDLTSPRRAPSLDLDRISEGNAAPTAKVASVPKERRGSLADSEGREPNARFGSFAIAEEDHAWDLSNYSGESDSGCPSEDGSERLSLMADEQDDDMFSDEQEEDSGDEIVDDDERELDLPPGRAYWDESTDSESGSEEDSDEDSDQDVTPLSPPVPTNALQPLQTVSPAKIHARESQPGALNQGARGEKRPSPSDLAIPRLSPGQNSNQNQNLVEKASKAEYFAAREVNRKKFPMREEGGPANGGHGPGEFNLPSISDLHHNRFYPYPLGQPPAMNIPSLRPVDEAVTMVPEAHRMGSNCMLLNYDAPINPGDDPLTCGGTQSTMNMRRTHVGISELVDHFEPSPECAHSTHEVLQTSVAPPPVTRRAPSFAQMITSRSYDEMECSRDFGMDQPQEAARTAPVATKQGPSSSAPTTTLPDPPATAPMATEQIPPTIEAANIDQDAATRRDGSSRGKPKEPVAPVVAGVKRRIAEISQESEEETACTTQSDTANNASTSVQPVVSSTTKPRIFTPITAGTLPLIATTGPTSPTTSEGERPTKRRRKVAEAFGIATLGAVSAGIGIFAALVATAPNFG